MNRLLLMFVLGWACTAAAQPVAVVTDLKGKATVAGRPVALLDYLARGSVLQVDSGASVVVAYLTAPIEVTLTGSGQARLDDKGPTALRGPAPTTRRLEPARAQAAGKLEAVQRERQGVAAVAMRRAQPVLVLDSPASASTVELQPVLGWEAVDGASGYRISLEDSTGRRILERSITGNRFVPDKGVLRHGGSYVWRVETTVKSGTLVSQAKLNVADEATARRAASLKPAAKAAFSERVLFAAYLETEGLSLDAKRAWRTLAAERPEEPSLQEWAAR